MGCWRPLRARLCETKLFTAFGSFTLRNWAVGVLWGLDYDTETKGLTSFQLWGLRNAKWEAGMPLFLMVGLYRCSGVVLAIPSFVVPLSVMKEGRKWEAEVIGEPVMVAHIVRWGGVCEVGLQNEKHEVAYLISQHPEPTS